jgi:anaphase-promoting complex subunit 8
MMKKIKLNENKSIMLEIFKGNIKLEFHDYQDSLKIFKNLLKLIPNNNYFKRKISIIYYNMIEYTKSMKYFENFKNNDPYSLEYMDTYSNLLYVLGEFKKLSLLAHESVLIDKYKPGLIFILLKNYKNNKKKKR